jgi:hypothetical protein
MRRVLLLSVVWLLVATGPAFGSEFDELLDRSAEAEFTGQEVLTCATPDGAEDAVINISQRDGVLYVSSTLGGSTVAAGAGTVSVASASGTVDALGVAAATDDPDPSAYVASPVAETAYLERTADLVTLQREGIERVRMWFDRETGALVRTDTLNKDGTVYCSIRMVSFTPGTPEVTVGVASTVRTLEAISDFDVRIFPDFVRGFRRLDVYAWDKVGEVAYYSDGYFAFVLYHSSRAVEVSDAIGSREVTLALGKYIRFFTPGRSTYVWETPAGGMVMVGDLPLDMQTDVLSKLSAPGKPGLFTRLIRRIFSSPVDLS